jgi:phosphopantothenoylcysteine decarboxylase/phosphopantothenate--cysteine ligase
MHTEMWEHPSVVDNIALLRSRGVVVVDPEDGRLAGGDRGAGRLASTDAIMSAVRTLFAAQDLSGRTVVVSAGGTREPIDAVRVIANRSTGRQGYAVARAAARRGATVHLVSTVSLPVPAGVEVVEVETAAEMQAGLERLAPAADVVVMAAAVADFTPVAPVEHKLKKSDGVPRIELVPTSDILAGLGATKQPGQVLVGFAAETERLETHAMAKLEAKGADLIVANDVSAPGVGFGHDTNAVTIFGHGRAPQAVALADKARIADVILDRVVELFGERA